MLSAVLSNYGSYSAVEEVFTTTAYYLSLPEETNEHVKENFQALVLVHESLSSRTSDLATVHEAVVHRQQESIAKCTLELHDTMQKTLVLFVGRFDESTMLRKLWSSMKSISSIASTACERLFVERDDNAMTGTTQSSHSWCVRPDIDNPSFLASSSKLKRTFERCRKCSSNSVYDSSDTALSHLNKHLGFLDSASTEHIRPEQWLASTRQKELEVSLEGMTKIVTVACETAQQLFLQAKELADGVRNEDEHMSSLYAFPHPLLSAFRQLLVFYFAIERSLFFTNKALDDRRLINETPEYIATLPFSPEGLKVIEVFGNGVHQAILAAREELCSMVKSNEPVDIFKRLSLNPEYICGWLMRRLLVKPLEKSMTVSDLYREYLSTIVSDQAPPTGVENADVAKQFQVNHRPSKRLLRSINLLQEEIAALQEVNTQQSKLVSKYMSVLDDTTYEKDIPSRRAMFPYERLLLESCRDSLKMTDQEYRYLIARCGPLSDSTKQSLEINEEDHGKAIMVFTIVTVIFLPLSFVTSFLGMNTTDIRDMGSSSTLFWTIAIPLTAVTMGSVLYIGYNGDDLRDAFDSAYRAVTGKQDRNISARGISVAQRKLARKTVAGSNSTLDYSSLADEAEFANPRPDDYYSTAWRGGNHYPHRQHTVDVPTMHWQPYASAADPVIPEPRTGLRTEPLKYTDYAPAPNVTVYNTTRLERPEARMYHETIALDDRHTRRRYSPPITPPPPPPVRRRDEDEWYSSGRPAERTQSRRHVPLETYKWTTKSHKRHQAPREGRRRRRDDPDVWSNAGPIQFRRGPVL